MDDTSLHAVRQSPFVDGNAFGISLADQKHCYEDGWRLYQKKMSCDDFNIDCDTQVAVTDEEFRSVFALYNIHSGLLRTFIHTHGFEIDDEMYAINIELTYGDTGESNLGYMLHETTPIILQDEKYDAHNTSNEDNVVIFPAYSEKWVVFDKFLSYDPSSDNFIPDLQFTINLSRINKTNLYVDGLFEFTTTGTIGSQGAKSNSIGLSDLKNIAYSYSDPGKWASDGHRQAEKIRGEDYEHSGDVANSIEDIANFIGDYSSPLGYANAALSLYDMFSGSGSRSSTSLVNLHSEGTLALEGVLESVAPIEIVTLGVHGSSQSSLVDEADLSTSGYTGKLGLISIKDRPKVILKSRLIDIKTQHVNGEPSLTYSGTAVIIDYRLISNLINLIDINPDSKMKLVNYGIRPSADFVTPGGVVINYDTYSTNDINCPVVSGGIGLDCINKNKIDFMKSLSNDLYKSANFIYSPLLSKIASTEKTINYNGALEGSFIRKSGTLRSVNHDPEWDIKITSENEIKELYLIVYVELQHKEKPDIFAEFTLKVPVEIGLCDSLDQSLISNHDTKEFFIPTADQCNGNNDSDGDGYSDNDEISAGSNPYIYADTPPASGDNCGSCHI